MNEPSRLELNGFDTVVAAERVIDTSIYRRFCFSVPGSLARGHVFLVSGKSPLQLSIHVDQWALEFDFTKYSARPGFAGKKYLGRPGLFLSNLVRNVSTLSGPCLGLNGNNIGYWPNQFCVVGNALVYKRRPGLFETHPESIETTAYFLHHDLSRGFDISPVGVTTEISNGERKIVPKQSLEFSCAISGYPLLRDSKPIWKEAWRDAWDPKLLIRVPEAHLSTRRELLEIVASSDLTRKSLQRHALTLAGTTKDGDLVIVAIEEHENSDGSRDGITVASAADLLLSLNAIHAIVMGAKGDVQAVSSLEGPIVRPLLSQHDIKSSRVANSFGYEIRPDICNYEQVVLERPIPSALTVGLASAPCMRQLPND